MDDCPNCNGSGWVTRYEDGDLAYHPRTCPVCKGTGRVQDERRICPHCHGTALSPYPDDGGSCPHCFGGYLP